MGGKGSRGSEPSTPPISRNKAASSSAARGLERSSSTVVESRVASDPTEEWRSGRWGRGKDRLWGDWDICIGLRFFSCVSGVGGG